MAPRHASPLLSELGTITWIVDQDQDNDQVVNDSMDDIEDGVVDTVDQGGVQGGASRGGSRVGTMSQSDIFVNMNTTSEAEKRRNRMLVRSHAARSSRGQQGARRGAGRKVSEPQNLNPGVRIPAATERTQRSNSQASNTISDDDALDVPTSSASSSVTTISSSSSTSRVNFDFRQFERFRRTGRGFDSVSNHISNPTSLLGGGRVDPFRTYPVDSIESSSYINELIDHSSTYLWPGLLQRDAKGQGNPLSSSWLARVMSSPLVMHALLFGASVHLDVLRSPRVKLQDANRLYHKLKAINLLNDELQNPETSSLDDVLLAVLALATNEVKTMENNQKEKLRSPFQSPLTSGQWLNVYGSISHVPAHTSAMRYLVGVRGGLEKVELNGLAEVISFSDILGATQNLTKPYFPLLPSSIKVSEAATFANPLLPHSPLGQGFHSLRNQGLNEDILGVLQNMSDLTLAIDRYGRGDPGNTDLAPILERRNVVQHNLMSLPSGDEGGASDSDDAFLYEPIRITAMIYSVAVLFPLPPSAGVHQKLVILLKAELEKTILDSCWTPFPQPLLWILTLAGIAAIGTPESPWFFQNLATLSTAVGISEWDDLGLILENFLWLDTACGSGGRSLWMRVLQEMFTKRTQLFSC